MPIPGWSPPGGSWTTHLPGWPQPVPPPDHEATNAALQAQATTVELNDFTASNVPLVGEDEEISLTTLEGWWDPVSDATDTARHPSGDGDIGFRLRQGGRVITVAGMIQTDPRDATPARLLTLMDHVTAQTRSGVLRVQERMRSMHREADVRRQSLQMTPLTDSYAVFTMVLIADDPVRYGSADIALPRNVSTGVANNGDVERCYPILEWTGAASNPGVDFGNLNWRLGENTASGDRIVVDCREGAVFKNGSRIFPNWTGFWPYTSSTSTFRFTAIGTSMTMRRRSGWS